MSIQFLGDHAIPPEVTRVAADSGLGDVQAAHRVPHRLATPGDEAKAKSADRRDGVLTIAAMGLPLALALLLWWATGSVGLGIGVGLVGTAIAFGATHFIMERGGNGKRGDRDWVYLCREGLVLPSEDQVPARAFKWTDFTAIHRGVTDNYVNRQHVFTGYSFRLVMADGVFIVFQGVELPNKPSPTEILKLGPVLEEEMFNRLLPPAVEAINAGGEVGFGQLALSTFGVTTPEGHLPWNEVGELSVGAGHLVLGSTRHKPSTYSIGDIPNFQVFWALAQNLRARSLG